MGHVRYDTGKGASDGVSLLNAMQSRKVQYVEGVMHLNMEGGPDPILSQEEINCHLLGIAMVQQFSLKAGLSKFGDWTKALVMKELRQHQNMKVYQPMDPDKMTEE